MVSLVGERDVQRDDVGRAQQRFQGQQADVQLTGALGQQVGIVADDLHAERACQLRDVPADPAQADHAHGLAAELSAFEALAIPFTAPHRRRGIRDTPHQRQQQPHRMLARADGVGAGRVHHGDAAPCRRGHVDRVHTRARARDHAQVRRVRHEGGGDTGLAAHDEGVRAGDRLVQLRRLPGDVDDFDIGRLGEQVDAAFRHTIGHDDAPRHSNARPISGSSSSSAATV